MEDWSLEALREGKVLLVNKPLDWTSFDVVNKIKFAIRKTHGLKKFKVGHAGTLDPKASGLLIVCAGRATKTIPDLMGQSKRYIAEVKLGETTPSYDTETQPDRNYPTEHITEQLISDTLSQFIGEIWQKPPIFSAIKKEGKRLYEHARKGQEVVIHARPIEVHSIELLALKDDVLTLNVHCGKGTYIRSLAHDLGLALQSGAYLIGLKRTAIGDFSLDDASEVEPICEKVRAAI